MALTAEDLRLRIGFSLDVWSIEDIGRAEVVLESSRTVILTYADADKVATAETDGDQPKLDALDQATLVYAVALFANPERRLQQRQGADYSTSWSDSVKAASGLDEAKAILDAAGLAASASGDAFSVDTTMTSYLDMHAEWCALNFDANYCDCGAIYAGYPIFGQPA